MSAGERLLPRPLRLNEREGEFVLLPGATVRASVEAEPVAGWLRARLAAATGYPLVCTDPQLDADTVAGIHLDLDPALGAEEYRLTVAPDGVRLVAGAVAGLAHGAQSLLQLLPASVYRAAAGSGVRWAAPACEIEDAPAFRWRGVLLDVARHFLPKREILRFIDLMALQRLNILHLHLTDDQGWRMQIERYPLLTEVGAWRHESQVGWGPGRPGDGRPHGGFYTQDDLREVVAYAAARGVTVVPEIESPGHVQAALAAYPELGVGGRRIEVGTRWGILPDIVNLEDATVEFFRNVLDEVMAVFPSPFIGVGGDEAVKTHWLEDERTRERMREIGATTPEEAQSWFIRQLDEHLTARGRRLYGWDEILEGGLAPGATVASWRGEVGAISAARAGHDVVLCPDTRLYFNYRQSEHPGEPIPLVTVITPRDVYALDPVPAALGPAERERVLGAQANLWTEYIDSPRTLDYFAYPRLCALGEALWTSRERSWAEFEPRLGRQLERLDALGVEYRREDGPLPWQTRPGIPGKPETLAERTATNDALTANIASS